ncbi:hypothetical protein JRQ81_017081 [Phrynocephalus forsythii]|uniref:WW domain binding protein 1 n=1 Tax=Phrynocephalus forsythii TaxID=171643 RepID=A0A9Q1B1X4_9SAUR|nr:hypothetical protein JRQ81_017081 [Phrynocephalus forsythii]
MEQQQQQPRRRPPLPPPPPAGREGQAGWAAALLGRERQAREYCPGVNNQPYVCETGHCCGETGCCIYYYELWWFWLLWTVLILFSCCCAYRHRRAKLRLQQQQRQREINLIAYHGASNYPPSMMDLRMLASFKLPAYEEVAHRPTTPPPPYSAILGGSASHLGSSTLTLTGSSDNYTSCSCESSCLTSPSSTSLSATEASTPSEGETEAGGAAGGCSSSTAGSWELAGQDEPDPATPHPRHALFSSNVELFEGEPRQFSDSDDGPEPVDEGEHFRHRRLTGDSGIEVGRGQEEEEVEEEATHLLEKGVPCSPQAPESQSLCGVQVGGDAEDLASLPVLPV